MNNLAEIEAELESFEIHKNGTMKTYILQKYLERPLLYNKRKFDIRCFMLMTSINGFNKGKLIILTFFKLDKYRILVLRWLFENEF
jgi:hypothetical protein